MKYVVMSDLHGRLPTPAVMPFADALILAGDVCPDYSPFITALCREHQMAWLDTTYREWDLLMRQRYDRIFFLPGNHDFIVELPKKLKSEFVVDQLVEHEDKKLYFLPWTPYSGGNVFWAYQCTDGMLSLKTREIPKNLDILVSHGPAYGCLDVAQSGYDCLGTRAGSRSIKSLVERVQPKVMVCGHIHEGRREGSSKMIGQTTVYNVARWGNDWKPTILEM